LLKPVQTDRFIEALTRVRRRLERPEKLHARLLALLDAQPNSNQYLRRLVVREIGKITLIDVSDVQWIESADNYARVRTGTTSHYLRMTMKDLEQRLDPEEFVRVHRTVIVAVRAISHLEPWSHGDYRVVLRNGERLPASRSYESNMKRLMQTNG